MIYETSEDLLIEHERRLLNTVSCLSDEADTGSVVRLCSLLAFNWLRSEIHYFSGCNSFARSLIPAVFEKLCYVDKQI